ncbi:MAG TPA: hypothetical protein VE466_08610 [Acidimicrobiales bacterium]|nr:hypothetical protein [Acidimicrobiales bacterium]
MTDLIRSLAVVGCLLLGLPACGDDDDGSGGEPGGRKAWIDLEGVAIVRPDDEVDPRGDDPASLVGETVSVWTTICRESYPEQCDAEQIVVG